MTEFVGNTQNMVGIYHIFQSYNLINQQLKKELFLTNLQNSMENHSMMLSTPVQSSCEDEAEDEDEGALTIHKSPNCICLCHCRKVLKYC